MAAVEAPPRLRRLRRGCWSSSWPSAGGSLKRMQPRRARTAGAKRDRRTDGRRAAGPGRALALGAMHGPAELLPDLLVRSRRADPVAARLGWVSRRPGGAQGLRGRAARRHGGGAADDAARRGDRGRTRGRASTPRAVVALSLLPPAVVGFALERPIERYLGKPGTIAAGLIAGGTAMAWADRDAAGARASTSASRDRRPVARRRPGLRAVPGRLAQWRDVDRGAAAALHTRRRRAALTARGAAGDRRRDRLKCLRLWQRGLPEGARPAVRGGRWSRRSPRRSARRG